MKHMFLQSRISFVVGFGLAFLVCCMCPVGLSGQSDNLSNAPVGKQWVDNASAESIATTQMISLNAELINLQNSGAQGEQVELVKARIQLYTDIIQNLNTGHAVYQAFAISYANSEATFLGDYLDVKVLNESQLIQIREEARKKLTV